MDIVSFLMLMALLAVVGGVVDAVRKWRAAKLGAEQVRKQALYAEETLKRPADIAVELLTQHLPTLVEKSAPHRPARRYQATNNIRGRTWQLNRWPMLKEPSSKPSPSSSESGPNRSLLGLETPVDVGSVAAFTRS
jgi:hypothetical protein